MTVRVVVRASLGGPMPRYGTSWSVRGPRATATGSSRAPGSASVPDGG
ncbi:hypothetical protein ACWGJV_31690 [Streptomyces tendae]